MTQARAEHNVLEGQNPAGAYGHGGVRGRLRELRTCPSGRVRARLAPRSPSGGLACERVGDQVQEPRRRRMGRCRVGRDDGSAQSLDGRGDRRGPAVERGGRRPRRRGGPQGVRRVGRQDTEGPDGAAAEARRRDRRQRRGADAARVAKRRQAEGDRRRRDAVLGRQPALLRRRGPHARRQGGGRVRRGLHLDHPARAARDRRGDHALELPADDGDLEARPGARRRQRPDPEAGRADAADDASLRRAGAGVPAAGRAPGRHRRRRPGRGRARPPSRDPARLPDRLGRDRQADRDRCRAVAT